MKVKAVGHHVSVLCDSGAAPGMQARRAHTHLVEARHLGAVRFPQLVPGVAEAGVCVHSRVAGLRLAQIGKVEEHSICGAASRRCALRFLDRRRVQEGAGHLVTEAQQVSLHHLTPAQVADQPRVRRRLLVSHSGRHRSHDGPQEDGVVCHVDAESDPLGGLMAAATPPLDSEVAVAAPAGPSGDVWSYTHSWKLDR